MAKLKSSPVFLWGPRYGNTQECQSERYPALFIRFSWYKDGSKGKLIYIRDSYSNETYEFKTLEEAFKEARKPMYANYPIMYIGRTQFGRFITNPDGEYNEKSNAGHRDRVDPNDRRNGGGRNRPIR